MHYFIGSIIHETLHQLESILQNTTDMFAAKVEKERM